MTEHQIPELDAKGYREFAIVTSAIVVGLFGLFFPWVFESTSWPRWPWIFAAILSTWGLIAPMTLKGVYKGWMRFGLLLSKITTPLIMGIVFYLVITPIGLIRRVTADDAMQRDFDDSDSYRVPSQKQPPNKLERPF